MRRILSLVAVALAVLPARAHAEIHAIPLPELVGEYQAMGDHYRVIQLVLPGQPAVIRGVSLRVRGTAETGIIVCGGPNGPVEIPWVTECVARMSDDAPNRVWSIEHAPSNDGGPFEWTQPFNGWSVFGAPLPTWDFLLDGTTEFEFVIVDNNVLLGCVGLEPAPKVQVEDVVLLLDADFAVPAEMSTWGRVKSAYR